MEALIIVAHGSKIKSSNDEIIEISNKIKNKNENTFYAFLELSEPSFYNVLKEVVEKEYKKIKSEIDTIISTCNHVDVNDVSALITINVFITKFSKRPSRVWAMVRI
jgi:hypothetical protein